MKPRKNVLGYRVSSGRRDNGYGRCSIEIFMGSIVDMAAVVKHDPHEDNCEDLRYLKETTGDTLFFTNSHHDRIEFQWQTSQGDYGIPEFDNWIPWYAMRACEHRVNSATLKILKMVHSEFGEYSDDSSPESFLSWLDTKSAVCVCYDSRLCGDRWRITERAEDCVSLAHVCDAVPC